MLTPGEDSLSYSQHSLIACGCFVELRLVVLPMRVDKPIVIFFMLGGHIDETLQGYLLALLRDIVSLSTV